MKITQEDIIKNYREVNAEQDYKIRILEAENQRLKNELDKQIKDNRKLVKALKEIADTETCTEEYGLKCAYEFHKLAKETLKEVGEEE